MSPAFKAAYHAELNRRMSTPEGRKEQREAMARMMASMKAAKAAKAAKAECFHIVRCAVTDEERCRVRRALDNARSTGDTQGTVLALAMLSGPCCN